MAVQINVAANQAALTASIQAGVQAYNQRFAQNNQLNLTVNQRAFSQPLGRMTGDVKDFEAALAASNARVIAFGASTAVLGGVIRSFKELANVTIEVEKSLADINRVFGLTTSQLQKFSTDLFSVSKQTASSFDDASKAALEFSRQGLKAEDVLMRTKDALTLTRLAGISTANAVDALTSTVNGFAATGISTTQILNKLVAVEQDYAVGAGDLAEALSRTGQAAQEAGVSLDQLNALVTSAQQSTARGGAVIGNALKTIFTRLQRTDTLDQLEAFNISVRDVQGNILPAVQILQNFAGAYKGLADAQRAQLSEQVAGVYQVNILKAIVGDLNKSQGVYAGALQRGASATNEAEVATAKLNQTLDALLKQTATSTQQLANNIGKVTFEPLARYGTEQLKSFVESMNEVLEGEGVGSTFANGLLKGIRNVIAGPGAIAAFFTLFKLIQNSFTYLAQALPQIAGITTETQNRKNIEQSILQIMQQQGPVSQALAGTMGNQAAQAQLLLQIARQQTAEYQMQSTLAKQLAAQLANQGVRVKGSGGLQVTRAGGYIPNATRMAEVVGAQTGGYSPGKVVRSPVGGVMNTAEDVKYIPGFAQPFINPPAGSKAGRAHRQNAISRTGVDPYMYSGFIPNFAQILDVAENPYNVKDGDTITADATIKRVRDFRLEKIDAVESNQLFGDQATNVAKKLYPKASDFAPAINASGKAAYDRLSFISQPLVDKLIDKGYGVPDLRYTDDQSLINRTEFAKKAKKGVWSQVSSRGLYTHPKAIQFLDQMGISKNEMDEEDKKYAMYKAAKAGRKKYGFESFFGFIPNFAPAVDSARIPWFKKYSSIYRNKSTDKDIFRQKDFPTFGDGLDHYYATNGNPDMMSYLYEDFLKSALNIALGSKQVVRPEEVGFKNTITNEISNRKPFDLTRKLPGNRLQKLEAKQSKNNQKETITQITDSKFKSLLQENPELAKNVDLMTVIFNDPRYVDPTGKNPAGILNPFEQSISSVVKNSYADIDPNTKTKLGKLTDGLLKRYETKKNNKFGSALFNGFIPNFAYKQAVMGLEESMSGEKAVFDTKPFPHIRNKSQPTFSSAISDHGGLSNALSDSMRGQKDAGLMNKGFVPNFAKKGKKNNNKSKAPASAALTDADIDAAISNLLTSIQNLDDQMSIFERMVGGRGKLIDAELGKLKNSLSGGGVSGAKLDAAMNKASTEIKNTQSKFSKNLSSASTAISIAGPMIAGVVEQAAFGDRKRTDMSATERGVQSGLSTGLTAVSTGVGIGANFGLAGAAIGGLIGVTVGLTSAFSAAKLSAEELMQLNQEQTQKAQANITAASSYIEAQKSLTQMILSGASSSDIETATKKLSDNFNEIKDVKLQEIFNATGGDVTLMTKQLQEYTNQVTKESAKKTGLYADKLTPQERASSLSLGLGKEQSGDFIKSARTALQEAQKKSDAVDKRVGLVKGDTAYTKFLYSLGDADRKIAKKPILEEFAKTQVLETDPNRDSNVKALVENLLNENYEEVLKILEKTNASSEGNKAVVDFNRKATKSFNQIFLDMEKIIAESAFNVALSFEKDSGSRRIQSAVLDFSMNFQDSLNSFISNNLPDARKFDFTAATAGQKAQMLLQKSQQDYDKAIAEQANERSIFLNKSSENLMKEFKSSFLPSQASAEYFKQEILPQLQTGKFQGNAQSLASDFENKALAKAKTSATGAKIEGVEKTNVEAKLKEIDDAMEKLRQSKQTDSTDYKNLITAQQDLIGLQKQIALFENTNAEEKMNNIINLSAQEMISFEQKQANAKKEAEINKQLSAVSIKANEAMAVKKAIVDKENLMRLENMKNVSATISNNLEISKAKSNAKINTLQGNLADPRLDYGSSAKEVTGRKIAIESQILKIQRAEEDAAINAEIQQRVLQMAAEQENTSALYALNETIGLYMGKLLEEDLGGAGAIAEMKNNPYMGKNIAFERANLGPEASAEQTKMLNQAESYSGQFQAYQRTQQSKTSASVIDKLDAKGFNAKDQDGKLLMSQKDQLDTLTEMSAEYAKNGDVVAKGIVDRYKAEIINKKTSLAITRENIDEELRRKQILEQQSHILTERFKKGYSGMSAASDRMIEDLVERTPERFADGMTNALMEVAKGTKSIGDAFTDMAINFGQEIMQAVMRAAIGKMVGSAFTGLFGQAGGSVTSSKIGRQTGGIIHAQNGMYISGGRTGDKNPAMLEDGEYVLNREAVKSFGGPRQLDKINYDMAPRFGKKMQGGGSFDFSPETAFDKEGQRYDTGNLMSSGSNIGQIDQANYSAYAYAEDAYFTKMREKSVREEAERVDKKFKKQQRTAQLVSSIVGAMGSAMVGHGMSGLAASAEASKTTQAASGAISTTATATKETVNGLIAAKEAGGKTLMTFVKEHSNELMVNGKSFDYLNSLNQVKQGLASQDVTGLFSKGVAGSRQLTSLLQQQGFQAATKAAGSGFLTNTFKAATTNVSSMFNSNRRGQQKGGLVGFNNGGFVPYGSRLSDTIPALLTGGEYVMNNTAVKKYGLGTMSSMNAGAYQEGGSTDTTNNKTNNNATNIAINIDKSGKSVYGGDSSSYEKQDIVISKNMARQINSIVLRSMSNEKRYGGELYKNPTRT